jgi:putative lipoic acid-binding regulatory protein
MPVENNRQTLLKFPCEFPIKVMGRSGINLRDLVIEIVSRHAGQFSPRAITARTSRNGNYVSVTAVVPATSQRQLDDIYRELSACELVLIAL